MKKINIKTIYLVAVISIGLICLAIGSTYAMFTTSAEINNPITISSNLTSNDDTMETFEVEVSPSATVTKTINISSGTVSNVNYSVWYINDISNIDIGVSSTSYTTAGTISNANTTVTTKISIRNNSSTTKTVTLGVALSKNSIVLASNMSLVPQKTLSNPLATHITNLYNNSTKTNVTNNMRVAQEEIFGPVAVVIKFKDEADVIRMANESVYGLGGAVWTQDINRAMRVAKAVQTGRIWVNTYNAIPAGAPFGGYKQSGIGRETHKVMLDHYSQTKNIMINLSENTLGLYE